MPYQLQFRSHLAASQHEVWAWITSVQGISTELAPWLRMSSPSGVQHLVELEWLPGQPLFRSRLYLFGVLPVDHSDLTLIEIQEGLGFVEQSPMGSMRLWRHQRSIEPGTEADGAAASGCTLVDTLTFEPRFAARFTAWCVQQLFAHRHRVLRRVLGAAQPV